MSPTQWHRRRTAATKGSLVNYSASSPTIFWKARVACMPRRSTLSSVSMRTTVLEPDLVVCCDPNKLTPQGIHGAPDLVVEVLSPGSAIADRKRKFAVYERSGVEEYWIVDGAGTVVEVYRLDDAERYRRTGAFGPDESITPRRFPDLAVDLTLVFRDP